MSLIRWNTRNELPNISSLFENLLPFESNLFAHVSKGTSIPAANVIEYENKFSLELAVPGKSKEDFKIEVENKRISISCEESTSNESENKSYTRKEYSFNSFCRSFNLPENINGDELSARYENGILKVSIPKLEIKAPKTKEVKVN